jgi:N-carbamoylputrescine amidase
MSKEQYKVGLVQMYCTPEPDENLARAIAKVQEAAKLGAEVVCLPELFMTQYFCHWPQFAEAE